MSKFNITNTNKTVNKSGHVAYSMSDKENLVTKVLTSFFNEDKYYGDTSKELVELAEKIATKEPRFISNLARYSRKEIHLRSVSHVLTCVVAKVVESKPFINVTVKDVVERPDDITEILACYLGMYGKPIPNGLKKALGRALRKFDEFQISKYNGGSKSVKFKDVLKLIHTKPTTAKEEQLFNKIMNDSLPIAKRWETELSTRGNTKEVWEDLIEHNQVGYMAGLRNLRNIVNAEPSNMQKILDKLENKEEVLKSKQLPFRYLSAYKELQGYCSNKVLDVLENAIEYSIENLPRLNGKTLIAIDVSGSMDIPISSKSKVQCNEIAMLLGVIASKMCNEYEVVTFDDKLKNITFSSRSGILSETFKNCEYWGGGTDLSLPFQYIIDNEKKFDRVILLSDNEINRYYGRTCQHEVEVYRNAVNKDLWVHAIDLQGYGTQQFIGKNTNIIAGWNERILEFIQYAEQGIDNQVNYIEYYHTQRGMLSYAT